MIKVFFWGGVIDDVEAEKLLEEKRIVVRVNFVLQNIHARVNI